MLGKFGSERIGYLAVFAVDDFENFLGGEFIDSCGGRIRLFRQEGFKLVRHLSLF